MKLKNMFAKPIERDIKGVIKVGQSDESNVRQELEEYVVTAELQKHFAKFFSNYNGSISGNTDKMGVWISGFFGSGKSHFLKILSYLLENKVVDGKTAIDYFTDDNKISDQMVLADIKRSSTVTTDVILFNIESKSEMNHSDSDNAILSVFLKVFNEMQGYCSTNFHLSDLERRLVLKNQYDEFKKCFLAHYGEDWEASRDDFNFITAVVADTLSEIGFMGSDSARSWCETAISPYNCSIEDFAKLVSEYINQKGDNHHVVFLVDEMGQYIGSNTKLMLSLQTLVENLGTYCHGKVWIIVTSQEDIDKVMKVEGRNDFSKIQGRFDTRLSLSSANVDEVIKKRILQKNETANQTLAALYDSKSTAVKNLVIFTDTMEMKLYSSGKDFASVYPFVPYQFNLLGHVLTAIRTHGASGKHLADGERSMLALFKESAVKIKEREQGELVPFNMFYDALENFLDHGHRGVIARALDNALLNPDKNEECFEVNLLKTLFMVKYVPGITANVDNLTSMMVSQIDNDRLVLMEKVEKTLKKLCEQMLVQRNGEIFIFLTDEEQEVNREIENQDVQMSEVISKVSEMIFDQIYPEKKYKLPIMNNKYSFGFNQFVDDKPYKNNQNYDFGINILTPNWDGVRNKQVLTVMAKNNIIVLLPEDSSFLDEILYGLKIEKYLRLNSSAATLTKYDEIKAAKKNESNRRKSSANSYLEDSLRNASIFVDGQELQVKGKDISSIFNEAFNRLVTNMYSKLPYMNAPKTEHDIMSTLNIKDKQAIIFGEEERPHNHLALNDVLEYIRLKSSQHTKTSYKSLIDRFRKPPYGFAEDDIAWLVAYLFRSGDVALFMNTEQISIQNKKTEEILAYLTKNAYAEKLLIEIRERATEKQIKSVKNVMNSLFGAIESDASEDSILESFKKKASELRFKLGSYKKEFELEPDLPGRPVIDKGIELMDSISQVSFTTQLFVVVDRQQDEYLDFAEDIDPVHIFFEGEQNKIFKRALKVANLYDDSKNFIAGYSNIEAIVDNIKNIVKMPHPYGEIHKLPDLITNFTRLYSSILENEKVPLLEALNTAKEHVFTVLRSKNYIKIFEGEFERKFDEIRNKIYECHNISSLQSINSEIHVLKINMLNKISQEENKVAEEKLTDPERVATDPSQNTPTLTKVKKLKNVSIKNLDTGYSWRIESLEDIDKYIGQLRENLMKELEQEENTIINIVF
jgi:hypothetical protein